MTVGWNPPSETGDITYTVTISPLAQLSATVLTSTSVTVTVDYNVSVVATNCAGNSTTAEYNFRIGIIIRDLTASYIFYNINSSIPLMQVAVLC